eukprot:CAMPEP_0168566368 /NCGR_PEP_ID=MMETSP0413-20121227/14383_1 /TAXON_ID=136452 /ORGANISM="Filamoeba nolandi, Strain NC-AS-23-1" /LENGTH=1321 /DNA_ID=CAMNT_0008598385 /DNA_START=51 /DNA_END=4013 /DNA_ORIENTATION=-
MAQWTKFKNVDPGKPKDFQVRVHVIECRDLQPRDSNGMSDPVCFVNVSGQKKNTIVHKKTTSCTFDHLMFFELNMMAEEFFMSKINVTIFDANTIMRNVEIGSYEFDAASVYEFPKHEIYRKWVALTDSAGEFKGIQGYLKLSITVLGPKDEPPAHEEAEEDDDEKTGADLQSMVLMPPTIATEQYSLDVSVYRAEGLPKMDNFGKIDGYVAVKFASNPEIKTEVIKKEYNPTWNETLSLPVTVPTMADIIKFQVRDWDQEGGDEIVGTTFLKYSDLVPSKPREPEPEPAPQQDLKQSSKSPKTPKATAQNNNNNNSLISFHEPPKPAIDYSKGRWINLYGVPEGTTTSGLGTAVETAKKMNEGFIEGSAYRGRVFMAMTTRKATDPKLSKAKTSPIPDVPVAAYALRFDLYEASEISGSSDVNVEVSVGPNKVESKKAKVTNGSATWYESLKELNFSAPKDLEQVPDIFINLWKRPTIGSDKRAGYIRIKATDLVKDGKPVWGILKADIFADSDANQIAGTIQYSISFAEASQLGSRPTLEKPQLKKYQLRAHLYQGRDLPSGDDNAASDPYCTIRMGKWSGKTKVIKSSCFPLWYETITFEVELPHNLAIASDVNIMTWDWDQIGGDDFLGRFSVKAQSLTAAFPELPTWYPIYQVDPSMPEGEILASFQLIPIEDVSKYPAQNITPKFRDCTLEISVVGLRDILPVQLLPVSNTYIEFDCGRDQKVKTKTSSKPKGSSPNFLEVLQLPVQVPENPLFAPPINIQVYDDRKIVRPLAGLRTISISPFVSWYNMSAENAGKGMDEGNTPVVDSIPGASLIKEEAPKEKPVETKVDLTSVDEEEEGPSPGTSATDTSSLLGSKKKQEDPGKLPVDKKKMLLKGLAEKRTKPDVAESLPEGISQEDLEEPKKVERPVMKHELENDLISKPPFLTLKLYRAKQQYGKKVKVEVGEFKGNFRVLDNANKAKAEAPMNLTEMFKPTEFMVRVYILECFQLVPKDSDGGNNPYIRISNGVHKIKDESDRKQNTSRPQIFKCYELPCTFPNQTVVDVEVWDWDPVPPHDLVGATRIDLENRFHSKEWKTLGMKPIEYRTLWNPSSSNPQGQVKMWVDILSLDEARRTPPENIAPPAPMACELRVIVWDTKEVVFKDEKMSDIFVSCYPEGIKPQFTDVHWRSEDHSGEFNWRMKFPMVLPYPTPRLKVQIWDKDVTNPDDAIGEAVVNLKPFFKKFYEKKSDRESLPKQYLTLTKTGETGVQGKVQLTIELMTEEESKRRPAGLGRGEPNANPFLDKPNRPETSFSWWRMDKLGKLMAIKAWRANRW